MYIIAGIFMIVILILIILIIRMNNKITIIQEQENKIEDSVSEIYNSILEKIFYLDAAGESSLIITFSLRSDGNVIDTLIRKLSANGYKIFIENDPVKSTELYYIGIDWSNLYNIETGGYR